MPPSGRGIGANQIHGRVPSALMTPGVGTTGRLAVSFDFGVGVFKKRPWVGSFPRRGVPGAANVRSNRRGRGRTLSSARRGRTHRGPAARPKHCASRQVKPLRSDHAAAAHLPEITSRTSPPSARDPRRTGVRLGFDARVAGRCPDSGGACRPRAAPAPKFSINPGVYRRRLLVVGLCFDPAPLTGRYGQNFAPAPKYQYFPRTHHGTYIATNPTGSHGALSSRPNHVKIRPISPAFP